MIRPRPRVQIVAGALAATLLAGTPAAAQGFPPTKLVNLRVLPPDSPTADVIGQMRQFSMALGVRCDHCHVGVDGEPLTTFDFASDVKPAKSTARAMMKLVRQINTTLDADVPGRSRRVGCATCHGGKRTPPLP